MVAQRTGFLQMSQGGEEADSEFLARLRGAARNCKFIDLNASTDPEAEMSQLQFIHGLRNKESKLKSFEAPRANENFTVEELLHLIQTRTHAKMFAESSAHQSTSSVSVTLELEAKMNFIASS